MSISFETITEETLYIALEIINSNPEYNLRGYNKELRSSEELRLELLNDNTISAFIKLDDTYIGIIDYLTNNPKDNYPWLGLILIHRDYQGYGFGSLAYTLFETEYLKSDVIRIGVLKENVNARSFWEGKEFIYYQTVVNDRGKEVDCFEKKLSRDE
ncbi:MAG: GNAT family N-acetyltransferase [Anaerobacillus sp.]|uniref:GNAT family N-acetyltransferase n=1 Tax=Anaerobacillus sp. TaxID=1872506 RepID=UPI00391AE975